MAGNKDPNITQLTNVRLTSSIPQNQIQQFLLGCLANRIQSSNPHFVRMDQFRNIGEVLGSMKALMVFQDSIQINQRQCCLLIDMFSFTYESVAEEMKHNLKFEDKDTKWQSLENPLKELCRVFKEAERYLRQCLESNNWWVKAITLYHNTDCVDFHIHNLLCCIPTVMEAIEITSGWDKKSLVHANKYSREWLGPKLFNWKFGKQYLITQDFCSRLESASREDRWILKNKIQAKKLSNPDHPTKCENRLTDLLHRILDGSQPQLSPTSYLLGSKDYSMQRRLGLGSQYKEIQWLGESFALRHFFADVDPLIPQLSLLLSLSHPNIVPYYCAFTDEDKRECYIVMELMSKNLNAYIKEVCGSRKRIPFSLAIKVDIMLQIARGLEYLHSKKIYHGDLNPSNILVKPRGTSSEGYLQAKVMGFGLSFSKNTSRKAPLNQENDLWFIWYAPEVLAEQEQMGTVGNSKFTDKSDVYSFGMVCFELLTGKVPFEDSHLQGGKMSRNIRTGERPLFPFYSLKYLTNLTKRCWHNDPNQRPSFSSICRILRYIKRFLVLNPDSNVQPELPSPTQVVDYCEIESGLVRKFPSWGSSNMQPVSHIPFEMFAYKVGETEKTLGSSKDPSESGSDKGLGCGDDNTTPVEDSFSNMPIEDPFPTIIEGKTPPSPETLRNKLSKVKKSLDAKPTKQTGNARRQSILPPQKTPYRNPSLNSDGRKKVMSPKVTPKSRIRRTSGNASDSELP